MKREIKFRAWDKDNKKMIDSSKDDRRDYDEYWGDAFGLQLGLIENISKDTRFELMQYTGLKDKNGKEIYEGDILGYWGNATWEVMWVNEKCAFRFGNYITNFPMTECKRKEIIGNIYENPELIK